MPIGDPPQYSAIAVTACQHGVDLRFARCLMCFPAELPAPIQGVSSAAFTVPFEALGKSYAEVVAERDALRARVAELEAQRNEADAAGANPKCKRCGDTGWLDGDPVRGISDEPCGCDESWEDEQR